MTLKKTSIAFCVVFSLGIIYSLIVRVRMERANRAVEVCLNFKETATLAERGSLSDESDASASALRTFLERCKIMGVSSVVVDEQSLYDLASLGKVIFFTGGEIEKLKSLGLSTGEMFNRRLLWIKKDAKLAERIVNSVGREKAVSRKVGDYIALENKFLPWDEEGDLRVGFDTDQMELLKELGLWFVSVLDEPEHLFFSASPDYELYSGMQSAWLLGTNLSELRLKYYLQKKNVSGMLQKSNANLALLETGMRPLGNVYNSMASSPEKIVRAHTISQEELKNMTAGQIKARWSRAVGERSCRFLYFRWHPDWNGEENLNVLRDTLQELKSEGYLFRKVPAAVGCAGIEKTLSSGICFIEKPFKQVRLFFAFMIAILGPLFAVKILKENLESGGASLRSVFELWGMAVSIAAVSGFLIVFLLPDTAFVTGMEIFRGVKVAILAPVVLSGFILFKPADIREFLRRKISIIELVVFALAALFVLVLIERSGNSGTARHSFELTTRSALEAILGVRPRFKEFLIGHPLMMLGIFLCLSSRMNGGHGSCNGVAVNLGKVFIWAGMVGIVSIVNSFCHLHTPIVVTLLRTFHGLWIGGLISLVLIFLFKAFRPFCEFLYGK